MSMGGGPSASESSGGGGGGEIHAGMSLAEQLAANATRLKKKREIKP